MHFKVEIVRYALHDPPGIVECRLFDAHGKEWTFVAKLPYVTAADLDADSDYPQPGELECERICFNDDGTIRVVAEFALSLDSSLEDFQLDLRPEQLAD